MPPGTATFYDTPHHEHNEIHVPTLHHEHNETHAPTNQVEQENMVMNVGRANLVDEANHDRSNPSFEGVGSSSAHETAVPPAANPDRAPTSSSSTSALDDIAAGYRIASVPTSYEGATGNWLMIRNNTVEEIRQELRNIIRDGEPEVAGEVAERLCRLLEAPRPSSLVDQTYRNLARPAVDECARVLLRHRPPQPVELEQRELELIRIWEMNIFTSAALNARSGSQVQELRAVEGEGSSAEWNASEGNNEERRTRPRTDDDDVTSLVGTARITSRTPRGHGAQGPGRTTARTAPSSSSGAAPSTGASTLTETTVWLTSRGALREPPPAEEEEPTCTDEAISRWISLLGLYSVPGTSLPTTVPEPVQQDVVMAFSRMGSRARGLMIRSLPQCLNLLQDELLQIAQEVPPRTAPSRPTAGSSTTARGREKKTPDGRPRIDETDQGDMVEVVLDDNDDLPPNEDDDEDSIYLQVTLTSCPTTRLSASTSQVEETQTFGDEEALLPNDDENEDSIYIQVTSTSRPLAYKNALTLQEHEVTALVQSPRQIQRSEQSEPEAEESSGVPGTPGRERSRTPSRLTAGVEPRLPAGIQRWFEGASLRLDLLRQMGGGNRHLLRTFENLVRNREVESYQAYADPFMAWLEAGMLDSDCQHTARPGMGNLGGDAAVGNLVGVFSA